MVSCHQFLDEKYTVIQYWMLLVIQLWMKIYAGIIIQYWMFLAIS